jgi:hypothetical protein
MSTDARKRVRKLNLVEEVKINTFESINLCINIGILFYFILHMLIHSLYIAGVSIIIHLCPSLKREK